MEPIKYRAYRADSITVNAADVTLRQSLEDSH
jgi:hypothetical protein